MRNLFVVLFLFCACFCFGQDKNDSLKEIEFMKYEAKGDSCYQNNDTACAKKYWKQAIEIETVCRVQSKLCRLDRNCGCILCETMSIIEACHGKGDAYFEMTKEYQKAKECYVFGVERLRVGYYGVKKSDNFFKEYKYFIGKITECDSLLKIQELKGK